ncbi:hypothetical protein ATCC90586_005786 [Pythium insidiosum]|nr:hypothetical protein ATCC90586_005786 [Pythium insidiosum]
MTAKPTLARLPTHVVPEKRFGIPYPLKKLDMVAVPDFLGAMENWGLATYAEKYLLVDEQLTSHEAKVDAARTVCHEVSHQWFGNLVTMDWWTGLWLNEGFAQYMEYEAVDVMFPEWRVWESFVQNVDLVALGRDAMLSSHPVEVIVNHASEVDQIFDVISYKKGASVVRMLAEFLGREAFYAGVHDYLRLYEASALAEEKDDCLSAMGSIPNEATQRRVLEWGMASTKTQELPCIFSGVAKAPGSGATLGWSFLQPRSAELQARLSPVSYARIVCASLNGFRTQREADAAEKFLRAQGMRGSERRIGTVLETVRLRAQEASCLREPLARWLQPAP